MKITRLYAAQLNRQAAEIRIFASKIAGAARLNVSCTRQKDVEEEVPDLEELILRIKVRSNAIAKAQPKMDSEDVHEMRAACLWVVLAFLAQANDFERVAAYAEQGTVH